MSRFSDVLVLPQREDEALRGVTALPLPVVNWNAIGQTAPSLVPINYSGPNAPLPQADVVVLTWTSAEWSALDHVFLNSSTPRLKSSHEWQQNWHLYTRNAPPPTAGMEGSPLWGYYQMVAITTASGTSQRVLVFKCDSHLAHPPWFQGLADMVTSILEDTKPQLIYSIGTAGGTREDVRLGDVAVTNAGFIKLQKPENTGAPINNQGFVSGGPFPPTGLLAAAEQNLFFDMTTVVTDAALQSALVQLHQQVPDSANFGLSDLVNPAIDPSKLHGSKALPTPGTYLLTTDYYYIATGTDAAQWAVLEMDDAVIGYVAGQKGINYAFVRNISDPIVPNVSASGTTIPDDVRDRWSGIIYENFGFYTSFNGAITTWATIAGHD